MKKRKFSKLLTKGSGINIVFRQGADSKVGVVLETCSDPEVILVQTNDQQRFEVQRKDIIGKVKKPKWFSMEKIPPENKALLLEHKDGSIKMGRLLGNDGIEFYDIQGRHFHDPYWHKPFPINDFTYWSLIQTR